MRGGVSNIIEFADPAVEAICLANYDNNQDGYITKPEAASITNISDVFKGNTEITSFKELKYFTGITSLGDTYFSGCTSLQYLTVPASVTYLGWKCFESCSALKELVLLREDAIIPAKSNTLSGMVVSDAIYVPYALVDSYKQADYWSEYADKFKPLSEYTE